MPDGNPNQAIFDAVVRHRIAIERATAADLKEVVKFLDEVKADIAARLARATPGRRAQLESLLEDARSIQGEAYRKITDSLSTRFRDRAAKEAAFHAEKFRAAGIEASINRLTGEAAFQAAMSRPMDGAILSDWLTELGEGGRRRVDKALRISWTEGESLGNAVKRVRATVDISKRSAQTLVRTANTHISNAVQQASAEANADIVKEVEWRSVLDSRTTWVCFPAETTVQALGSTEKLYRRWYEGKVIVITTAHGNQLRGTPNHPVLTATGWLPLHKVKEGTQVFNADLLKVGGVHGGKNVSMPTSFGAISDALNKPALSDVLVVGSSPADFHGDGMGSDQEIDVVNPKGDLRLWVKSGAPQHVINALFGARHCGPFLSAEGAAEPHFIRGAPLAQASEVAASAMQALVKPAFGSTALKAVEDFAGSLACVEHGNSADLIGADKFVKFAPSQAGSHASVLEQGSYGGDGAPIFFCELPGGDAVRVLSDYVVSVRIEDAACHVYNLQTSIGYYIAGGLIVHNCRSRDGEVYPVNSGPRPPAHAGCRSIVTERLKDFPPPQRETYADWLKRQPATVQDEIIGPARGKLLRAGKFDVQDFVDLRGKPLTLDELAAGRKTKTPVFAETARRRSAPQPIPKKTAIEIETGVPSFERTRATAAATKDLVKQVSEMSGADLRAALRRSPRAGVVEPAGELIDFALGKMTQAQLRKTLKNTTGEVLTKDTLLSLPQIRQKILDALKGDAALVNQVVKRATKTAAVKSSKPKAKSGEAAQKAAVKSLVSEVAEMDLADLRKALARKHDPSVVEPKGVYIEFAIGKMTLAQLKRVYKNVFGRTYKGTTMIEAREEILAAVNGSGKVDRDLSALLKSKNAAAKNSVLKHGKANDTESLVAIDEDTASVIGQRVGTKNTVFVPDEVEPLLADPTKRIVFHHNHPSSTSLSAADLVMAEMPGVSGVWAHGHNGSSFFARVKAGSDVRRAASVMKSRVNKELSDVVRSGAMSPAEAAALENHLVNLALSKSGVIEYKFKLAGEASAAALMHKSAIAAIIKRLK